LRKERIVFSLPVFCIAGNPWLAPGFAFLMDRYWPRADLTILHWDDLILKDQPMTKAKYHCLGEDQGVDKWSDSLIPFFQDAPDYFAVMLEDYWLNRPVNNHVIEILAAHQEIWGFAKMDLYKGVMSLPHTLDCRFNGFNLLELPQTERYRTSLHLNIWRKDYFLKLLRPGLSPWQFELNNPSVINDGELILGTDLCPVSYVNVVRGGMNDRKAMKELIQDDLDEMKRRRICVPAWG